MHTLTPYKLSVIFDVGFLVPHRKAQMSIQGNNVTNTSTPLMFISIAESWIHL